MAKSHLQLKRIFNHYNKRYFNNELPADTSVTWAALNGNDGECQGGAIRLDAILAAVPCYARIILLHEMIHVRFPKATHGKVFRAERQRLLDAGAYDNLL
jgi:hypothetical protein